ncbi:MAG TPA: helix-turn-helix transcriptional regulator [Candidatus Omnitrophota bacterium]|nr:helix-turn-helix transcriptional regulator [Candidatus Omnitrophota bacterium]
MDKELQEWYKLHEFYMYGGNYQTRDLAGFLGVSERTIQRWLKEKSKPSAKQLAQIREYVEMKKSASNAL